MKHIYKKTNRALIEIIIMIHLGTYLQELHCTNMADNRINNQYIGF